MLTCHVYKPLISEMHQPRLPGLHGPGRPSGDKSRKELLREAQARRRKKNNLRSLSVMVPSEFLDQVKISAQENDQTMTDFVIEQLTKSIAK